MIADASAAFDASRWHEFGVGAAGASAALTGLLFVSLSINLAQILGNAWLPRRAGLTLVLLFETLVISLVVLTPIGSRVSLGLALLAPAVLGWIWATLTFMVRTPPFRPLGPILVNSISVEVVTLVVIASALSVLVGAGGGLLWLAPGMALLLGIGIMNSWILLIETLR